MDLPCPGFVSLEASAAFVDVVVVAGIEQRQVVEVDGAVAAEPFVEVVCLAPAGWPVAARPYAAPVAYDEGPLPG